GSPWRAAFRPAARGIRRTYPRLRSVAGEPLPHHLDQAIVGHVHVEGRHGDVAVAGGAEIGICIAAPRDATTADPIDLLAPWVLHERDFLAEDPASKMRHLHPLHLVPRKSGQV